MVKRVAAACVAGLALLSVPGARGEARVSPPARWLDLSFSRRTPGTRLVVDRRSAFVLRADRDVTAIRVEVRAAHGVAGGDWQVRLLTLPKSEEADPPDFSQLAEQSVLWSRTGALPSGPSLATTIPIQVPRAWFQNWLLLLEPRDARPVP
ncbi:MAG TPA: hypothetical protein VFU47_09695, partial [Armatimonadota bacterium]|nr:hypothetical protein [Armatimonadota bacterium]